MSKRFGVIVALVFLLLSYFFMLYISNIARFLHGCLSDYADLPFVNEFSKQQYDVGIVLGYELKSNGIPTHQLEMRVQKGVDLLLQGNVQCLLMSGARPDKFRHTNITEASVMAKLAKEKIQKKVGTTGSLKIILEEKSTSTRENAIYSLPLITQTGQSTKIILITNKFHQFRAYYTFMQVVKEMKANIEIRVARLQHDVDNDKVEGFKGLYVFTREVAAIAYYLLRGYMYDSLLVITGAIIIGTVRVYRN